MSRKILIVEDDDDISRLLEIHLRDAGYTVSLAHDGTAGAELAHSRPFDMVILDIMLPGLDGLELCRRIRATIPYTPILLLTARSSELDRVVGLEMGADDYVTKPFSIPELMARVKALLRRVEALQGEAVSKKTIHAGGELLIDTEKRSVALNNRPVELTAKEFDLLVQFAKHPGRVYTRMELLNLVWGYGYEGYEHTVNSHINRLRAKIEADPARPRYILTVWGIGYKFSDAEKR
jgi:two-component system, OmpR family, alkaline phosphatase synthesis response regulator PhoP